MSFTSELPTNEFDRFPFIREKTIQALKAAQADMGLPPDAHCINVTYFATGLEPECIQNIVDAIKTQTKQGSPEKQLEQGRLENLGQRVELFVNHPFDRFTPQDQQAMIALRHVQDRLGLPQKVTKVDGKFVAEGLTDEQIAEVINRF